LKPASNTDAPEGDEDSEPEFDEESVGDAPSDDDIEPSEEDTPPAAAKSKGGLKVPVKPPTKQASRPDDAPAGGPGALAGVNLDSLSSGLMVKQPPKLLSKPDAPVPAATAARPELRKPVAPSATGTREGAIKAPPSAALAAATAAPASTADDLTSLSTATAAVPGSVAPSVATAAATVPGQEELVLRDPDVVRSEALASVSKPRCFQLCSGTAAQCCPLPSQCGPPKLY
jgi:hypothetical protein